MAEPLKKEKQETQTLEEWYSKVYDYDPSIKEVEKSYTEDFFEKLKQI